MEITEEQKKKVKFKTHTCTIHILGEAKEYTYENVIWLSSNKKWIFYITSDDHFQIEKIDDIIGDLPHLYDNDEISYNDRYRIPKYIQDKVEKTLIKITKQ